MNLFEQLGYDSNDREVLEARERVKIADVIERGIHVSVDPETFDVYVTLVLDAVVVRTEDKGDGVLVDYDEDGDVVGVEILRSF